VDIINIITSLVSTYGYLGIFIAAFAETIFPPIPSELIFPLAGFVGFKSNFTYFETFLMASSGAVGATFGAIVIYIVSFKIGRIAIVKLGKYVFVNEKKIESAERWFEKYGVYAVFLGRMVPGVRELISVPAGIARMPFAKFVTFTFFGSLIWSVILVFLGYFLGDSWESLSETLSDYFTVISVLVLLSIAIVIFYYVYYGKRRDRIKN
jgi:membrane protein DedA with SNARE-associated domain